MATLSCNSRCHVRWRKYSTKLEIATSPKFADASFLRDSAIGNTSNEKIPKLERRIVSTSSYNLHPSNAFNNKLVGLTSGRPPFHCVQNLEPPCKSNLSGQT